MLPDVAHWLWVRPARRPHRGLRLAIVQSISKESARVVAAGHGREKVSSSTNPFSANPCTTPRLNVAERMPPPDSARPMALWPVGISIFFFSRLIANAPRSSFAIATASYWCFAIVTATVRKSWVCGVNPKGSGGSNSASISAFPITSGVRASSRGVPYAVSCSSVANLRNFSCTGSSSPRNSPAPSRPFKPPSSNARSHFTVSGPHRPQSPNVLLRLERGSRK